MGRRRFYRPRPQPEHQHRVNERIRISPIRVIGPDGDQVGVMSADEGRAVAAEHGLDLVEVSPNARPPVCKVLDYGKFRYDQAKKESANRSAKVELKTVQMRPKTDDHDLDTKIRRAARFLDSGNPVRFVMRMRGRERSYADRWIKLLDDIVSRLEQDVTVRAAPKVEGRNITATVEPG